MAVLLSVVASLIWFLIGVLARTIFVYVRLRLPAHRVWGFDRRESSVAIAVASIEREEEGGEYSRPTTGMGELKSLVVVRQSLISTYTSIDEPEVQFSSSFPADLLKRPLVCLGGAKHNRVTRLIANRYDLPFEMRTDPVCVHDIESDEKFEPRFDGGDSVIDYAVISRLPNPFETDVPAILVRGLHTFGVAGAGQIFASGSIRNLSQAVDDLGDWWQVLLKVESVDDSAFPTIVRSRAVPLPSASP